jgi:hypothetical protein
MNNLPSIIGPAPSELSLEALRQKLTTERDRVRRALQFFQSSKHKPSKSLPRGGSLNKTTKGITLAMQEAGLSPAEILKGIALLKKEAANAKT